MSNEPVTDGIVCPHCKKCILWEMDHNLDLWNVRAATEEEFNSE